MLDLQAGLAPCYSKTASKDQRNGSLLLLIETALVKQKMKCDPVSELALADSSLQAQLF